MGGCNHASLTLRAAQKLKVNIVILSTALMEFLAQRTSATFIFLLDLGMHRQMIISNVGATSLKCLNSNNRVAHKQQRQDFCHYSFSSLSLSQLSYHPQVPLFPCGFTVLGHHQGPHAAGLKQCGKKREEGLSHWLLTV